MRIMLISWEYPPIMIGGLGRHVYELSKNLALLGHEILILSQGAADRGEINSYEKVSENIHIIRVVEELGLSFFDDIVAWTLSLSASMIRAYSEFASDFQPDIIHAHDWIIFQAAVTLAEYTHAPLILTVHATEAGRHMGWINQPISQRIHSIEWWFMQQADQIIVCSEFMHQELNEIMQKDLAHITVIPNGIDQQFWSEQKTLPQTLPRKINADKNPTPLKLLFFGRLEYEKGVHDVILALPEILTYLPQTQLSIVGQGTQENWLKKLVDDEKLSPHVHFYSHLDAMKLRDCIDNHDIIILPSRYEPSGIVALEAAMRIKPQIVSNRSGMAELLIDSGEFPEKTEPEYLGEVCEPANPASIAQCVRIIDKNYPFYQQKAAQLKEKLTSLTYDWAGVTARTVDVYEKILGKKHQKNKITLAQFPERVLENRP